MSKRFTDTELWDKEWFMLMSPAEKCAIKYIFDKCDCIGIWSPNFTLAEFFIKEKINWQELPQKCNENVEILPNGKWWLKDFCCFQYGILTEDCPPHKKYLSELKKQGLYERVAKGYQKGINTLQEEEEEKEEEKEKEKEMFDIARRLYPDKKRGLSTEFDNFTRKHKDWRLVLPLLEPAIRNQMAWRAGMKLQQSTDPTVFIPNWKNFKTWINQRCWEEELPISPEIKELGRNYKQEYLEAERIKRELTKTTS